MQTGPSAGFKVSGWEDDHVVMSGLREGVGHDLVHILFHHDSKINVRTFSGEKLTNYLLMAIISAGHLTWSAAKTRQPDPSENLLHINVKHTSVNIQLYG